jgi:hypothetical protein
LRDKQSLLFLVLMPVVFHLLLWLCVWWELGAQGDKRLQIGRRNQDSGGIYLKPWIDLLESSNTVRPLAVAAEDAAEIDQCRAAR